MGSEFLCLSKKLLEDTDVNGPQTSLSSKTVEINDRDNHFYIPAAWHMVDAQKVYVDFVKDQTHLNQFLYVWC